MSTPSNPDPAYGRDGEQPLPGDGARDPARAPDSAPDATTPDVTPDVMVPSGGEDDEEWDADSDLARLLEDIDAGVIPIPPEDEPAPAVTVALGETADVDPAALAAMAGPDGLGGEAFSQHAAADALRPGPLLSVLTEQAAANLGTLTGNELLGVVSAARRLQNRAEYLELAAVAEFARRAQDAYAASVEAKARPGRRDGEFADAELAMELVTSQRAAGDRMEFAAALETRLPCTFAGLADGTIDGGKASTIWFYTRFLSDADAAEADRVLAAAAPGLRHDSLARKAAKLENKLDPEAVRQRKEHARKDGRRVEARRELSGNMSFGGRELAVEEALAAKAFNDGDALALRRAGMLGSLRELRVLAMLDRMAGRNPFDRLTAPAQSDHDDAGQDVGNDEHPDDAINHDDWESPIWCPEHEQDEGEDEDDGQPGGGASGTSVPGTAGAPVPLPAVINLIVTDATLLGWSTAPGDAGTWGILDADDTRTLVQAASQHPSTRWHVTVTGPDGTAIAHGRARGQHPWAPANRQPSGGGGRDGPGRARDGTIPAPGPDAHQAAQLAALLRALNVTLSPIAVGICDHRHREDRYTPSRKLKDLVRARTATCPAPGCGAQAIHCDLDHTVAYPGGATDECNLAPPCRRHHRVKQAPGWHLEQPAPGVMKWTTPSGRVHTTTPTVYDL